MAFDDKTRRTLFKAVSACRNLLTDDFDEQLRSRFGIYAKEGRVLELEKLTALTDAQRGIAQVLRERITHLSAGKGREGIHEAVQRILREQAFTILNRFAAVRMAEERGIISQSVGAGMQSRGFRVFADAAGGEQAAGASLGQQHDRYLVYLDCLFDELSLDLGVLFDRADAMGLLFPSEAALRRLFEELNRPEIAPLWTEDETIGWIYQYYNDPDERKKMREDSPAPRNSRELAVRNQFFTPRYVVEFLTDNTLGRIWYEMTRGETTLKEQCRYLVRRPSEFFLPSPDSCSLSDAFHGREEMLAFWRSGNAADLPENPDVGVVMDWLNRLRPGGFEPELGLLGTDHQTVMDRWFVPVEQGNPPAELSELHPVILMHCLWRVGVQIERSGYDDMRRPVSEDALASQIWSCLRHRLLHPAGNVSQEDLIKLPVHIPHRPLKDPRTILMLDPACGSMHFGLYAFDLFEVIYEEAWELEKRGVEFQNRPPGMLSLQESYGTKDAFLKDVPRLIIEHNLHGIDIDPRCAQIAGLSLWLRAQKAWQRFGLKPSERPAIKRSNIVCAEPMPGEKELLREFVEREFPGAERAVCLRLLEAIFDKMQLAGEAGSLLKIEEEIRSAIEDARDAWQKLATKPPELFNTTELNQLSTAPELTGLDQAVSSLTTDPRHLTTDFWERIEEGIYAALRDYAEQAENGGGFQRRLFAEDAARGFAFIDVCRKRYDVALMNPPFGEATASLKFLIQLKFQLSKYDLGATFLDCVSSMLTPTGCVGLLSNRTIYFLSRLSAFRKHALNTFGISCFADLGSGVLDAMVEAAAACFAKSASTGQAVFSRNTQDDDKGAALLENLREANSTNVFITRTAALAESDTCEFCYWIPQAIQVLRGTPQTLGHAGVEVRQGIATGDNFRFLRLLWEIPAGELFQLWHPYAKGGDYSPLFYSIHLCVVWGSKWRDFFNGNTTVFSCLVTRNSEKYLNRPGLTYPTRTSSRFAPRMMPAGTIFDTKGSAIFHPTIKTIGDDSKPLIALAALLNTALAQCIVDTYVGAAEDSSRSYGEGVIERLPFTPALIDTAATHEKFGRLITKLFAIARRDERAQYFVASFSGVGTLREQCDQCVRSCKETSAEYDRFFQECDSMVSEKLNLDKPSREFIANEVARYPSLTPDCLTCPDHRSFIEQIVAELLGVAFGRWDIRYAKGEQAAPELPDPFAPLPVCPPGQLQNAQGLPARPEDVPAAYPVRIPWDGILVDDPNHPLDVERRVREVIEIIWSGQEGGPKAEAIEHEACEILGVKSLRDYFRKPAGFFADHLKRYSKSRRKAPIYWPLSTASGSYTLWIYYHRLTSQTLFTCVSEFIDPKREEIGRELDGLRSRIGTGGNVKERQQVEDLANFQAELKTFRDDLLKITALPYRPNLNDGVQITAAPLWKCFLHTPWQNVLKTTWKELEKGDYDWAHLPLPIWPERVKKKCKTDRSIAIAHDLEDLCEVKAPEPKKKRASKKAGKKAEQEEPA